jgi:hypothetical protein
VKLRIAVAAALLVALALAPSALAKFRITLLLGDSSPAVGQPLTVALRTDIELPPDHALELVAVAPRVDKYDVLSVHDRTDSVPADLGFAIDLRRTAPDRWRGLARFPHAGRWLLIVPNWGAVGYAFPQPVVRPVVVHRG